MEQEARKFVNSNQSNQPTNLPSGGAATMFSFVGSNTSSGSNTLPVNSAGFQNRNEGGQILNTTQPRQQDQREDKRVNGFRLFPVVTNKRTKNYRTSKENIDKFTKIFERFKLFGMDGDGGGGGLLSMFGLNGGGVVGPLSTGGRGGGYTNASAVYNYLLSKGMSANHAKGLVANISRESGFKLGAHGDKGIGGSFGLFQWNMVAGRGGPMMAAVPDWKTNWKGQIDYALKEFTGPQYLNTQFSTAGEAAHWWMANWEIPAASIQAKYSPSVYENLINKMGLKSNMPNTPSLTPTPASNGNLKVSFNKNNNTQYVLMPMIQREVVTQPVPVSDGSDSLLLNITKIVHDHNQELFALV